MLGPWFCLWGDTEWWILHDYVEQVIEHGWASQRGPEAEGTGRQGSWEQWIPELNVVRRRGQEITDRTGALPGALSFERATDISHSCRQWDCGATSSRTNAGAWASTGQG